MNAADTMPSRIHTFTGRFVYPLDLRPEDVCIEDIAHHLGNQCRWSGAYREFYSVAQHSVLCSRIVAPGFEWDALHHDDAEYLLQDMAKPLKNHPVLGAAYRQVEAQIEQVIGPVLGVCFPHPPEVKEADIIMLVTEARDGMHGTDDWENYRDVEPLAQHIKPWSPRRSRREFMLRYKALGGSALDV